MLLTYLKLRVMVRTRVFKVGCRDNQVRLVSAKIYDSKKPVCDIAGTSITVAQFNQYGMNSATQGFKDAHTMLK